MRIDVNSPGVIHIELEPAPDSSGGAGARRHEPVTLGVPFPKGFLTEHTQLSLRTHAGTAVPLQGRVLDRWSDGSIRWLLADFQADAGPAGITRYALSIADGAGRREGPSIAVRHAGAALVVDTGGAIFHIAGARFFQSVSVSGRPAIDPAHSGLEVEDMAGRPCGISMLRPVLEEEGVLRTCVRLEGSISLPSNQRALTLMARLHFFAGSPVVRCEVAIRNPARSGHPGGHWPLGSAGAAYVRDVSFAIAPAEAGAHVVRVSEEDAMPFERRDPPVEIYQDSSGGERWDGSNHVNRQGRVPNTFRGYRARAGVTERAGLRATPIVGFETPAGALAMTMPQFWQNCPKAIEATSDGLRLRLFPRQYADVHEIQGGEQKTHTFFVAFGHDRVAEVPLAWARRPSQARVTPDWHASSAAVPWLTPAASDSNTTYRRLVDAAIEGSDTFVHKRERIDEYGWRNFGDIYADHEAAFHTGPQPLVSHYNNQYDAIAGCAIQFFRSGDWRWRELMTDLAEHVADIDVYHTSEDKAAYNHGLFWHTYHYKDARTATHRSYPVDEGITGGGPSAEHNYTTGLMLHYFLTGSARSRETVIGLARWVLDMDDGRKSRLRWVHHGDTGLASATAEPGYHGPGRGAAYSINALLDAHRLSGEPWFLGKAERLIRRCIHPADDIERRDLLNPERRWSYTVFLQVLGKYLEYKADRAEVDAAYAYARASLLAYARWMAVHERPHLDRPELLEHPTETWAAQDMRKSEVFKWAAALTSGVEREQFRERADFFFTYATITLAGMPTATRARPVVLLLSNGYRHAFFQAHPETSLPQVANSASTFGTPGRFIPQRERAKRRLATVAFVLAGVLLAAVAWWFS